MASVDNTFDILEVFLKHGGELGVKEVSDLSGVSISTTCRVTANLVRRGYLQQPKNRGKYSLGLRFLDYYSAVRKGSNIVQVATPYMAKLNSIIDESICLSVLDSGEAVKIAVTESHQMLSVSSTVGTRTNLHCIAEGKLLLAHLSEKEIDNYITNHGLNYFTPNTITDANKLKKELSNIRLNNIAIDNEEMRTGVRGIAAPVQNETGKVIASLGLIGPASRLIIERDREVIPLITGIAKEISRAMGFNGD
jgi:IclR family transcriptional regulator, KDG regulon repressor